jgi:hypothetical protein
MLASKSWFTFGRLCLRIVCIVTPLLAGCSNPQVTAMHGEESSIMVRAVYCRSEEACCCVIPRRPPTQALGGVNNIMNSA